MKKIIEIAQSKTVVNTAMVEIDFPEEAKFYKTVPEFDRDLELFAIVPKFLHAPTDTYTLVKVSYGKQDSTDFRLSDCKREFWLDRSHVETLLRHEAIEILEASFVRDWKEIGEAFFMSKRKELLDCDCF